MKDFSDSIETYTRLTGVMDKTLVLFQGVGYILKFDVRDFKGTVCEYIASKLAKEMRIPCQEVTLGIYKGDYCCAIKLLTKNRESIHSYKEINNSSLSPEENIRRIPYNLPYILKTIRGYKNLNISVEERLKAFEEMCYFDALIGNFDRHWGNWGFIGTRKNYRICPLYDNGSSLFPGIGEELPKTEEDIMKAVLKFPNSSIKNKNKRYKYKYLVEDLTEKFGDSLLRDFCERFEKVDLKELLYEDELLKIRLGEDELDYVYKIINLRYQNILKEVLINGKPSYK